MLQPLPALALALQSARLIVSVSTLFALASLSACGEELGDCDPIAANELVYSDSWRVATKGQALLNDSCGNASFCHSSAARGADRVGAPAELDFDMLPLATGWPKVIDQRELIWKVVENGTMPPSGKGHDKVSTGDWTYDPLRRPDADRMPTLKSDEGKAALRNWLACGAPVVKQTQVPLWARGQEPIDYSDWQGIYEGILKPNCRGGGCHGTANPAAGLDFDDDECKVFNSLFTGADCASVKGVPRLSAGDAQSFLLNKVMSAEPKCGDPMPTTAPLPAADVERIRAWIVDYNAAAKNCPRE